MSFVYFLLLIAVLLLANVARIEKAIANYRNKKNTVHYSHADKLLMDIGNTLINKNGIEQYEELKPKLEQAKRYYLSASNKQAINNTHQNTDKKEPIKLKVVS